MGQNSFHAKEVFDTFLRSGDSIRYLEILEAERRDLSGPRTERNKPDLSR